MITEEDIKQLLDEWNEVPAWIKAHVSAKYPPHRYVGELSLENESLIYRGRDIKEDKNYQLGIPLDNITKTEVGFSKQLEADNELVLGIGDTVSFVVRYHYQGNEYAVYFIRKTSY
jgi:hypothetical protein